MLRCADDRIALTNNCSSGDATTQMPVRRPPEGHLAADGRCGPDDTPKIGVIEQGRPWNAFTPVVADPSRVDPSGRLAERIGALACELTDGRPADTVPGMHHLVAS